MKQVTQTLRSGRIEIKEVPVPSLRDSFILVQNSASIISAGTEKTKIDIGKMGLIQKANARPDLVRQVMKKLKTEGIKKTLQTINSRLDNPSPLGYSSAGKVVAVGGHVEGLQPGDRVACGGAGYANHADFISVPKNLAVRIPENVSDDEAAFTTIGAIALQGLRLAEPKLGETFAVIGLGLIGQITIQLLKANGCNVIGSDLDQSLVTRARERYDATPATPDNLVQIAHEVTNGHGVDGVLICAGTTSNHPIELCGEITREKGRVVVIGAVRMDIPRDEYFKKEISVIISRSYGPGRYDPSYEESGQDYPFGYVRFTEKRNMESFLYLLSIGAIEVKSLITHRFELCQATEAYQLIEGSKHEPYLGIILNYNAPSNNPAQSAKRTTLSTSAFKGDSIRVSFFGAGNYATASLFPPLKEFRNISFNGLVTASGRSAQDVASRYGMRFCASTLSELLKDDTDCIVISTRHDSHANAVIDALNSNKHVYVEKPLGLTADELARIDTAYQKRRNVQLMVGFNRRFSSLTKHINNHFAQVRSPLVVSIRVNAGCIPPLHWVHDPAIGGGRVIGEGCHFIDLASALVNCVPSKVYATALRAGNKSNLLNDNVLISLQFKNGSIANITYTSSGSKAQKKEYVEVFGGGKSAIIDDFKAVHLFEGDTSTKQKRLSAQDKGQKHMLQSWIDGLISGEPCISYDTLLLNSLTVILAIESLNIGMPLEVCPSILEAYK